MANSSNYRDVANSLLASSRLLLSSIDKDTLPNRIYYSEVAINLINFSINIEKTYLFGHHLDQTDLANKLTIFTTEFTEDSTPPYKQEVIDTLNTAISFITKHTTNRST